MATDSVKKVDDLSKEDRAVVVGALELSRTSQLRAAKAAKSEAVRIAFEAEAAKTDSLISRFR